MSLQKIRILAVFKPGVCRLRPAAAAFILLVSCAGSAAHGPSENRHLIENVPFHAGKANQCGPQALAGVLNYWDSRDSRDIGASPDEIAREIYSDSAKGTLNLDMLLYARRSGLTARQYKGSIGDIKDNIDAGRPLIVMVDYGFWVYRQGHFMVVVGYDADGIIADSGAQRHKFIPLDDFLKKWERTGFWTLLVMPEK